MERDGVCSGAQVAARAVPSPESCVIHGDRRLEDGGRCSRYLGLMAMVHEWRGNGNEARNLLTPLSRPGHKFGGHPKFHGFM